MADPGNAQRAKDATYVRDFVERVGKRCASMGEVSAIFGTDRTDMQRFEQILREQFGYNDSAVIERLYVCTDFLDDGGISPFELTHLFSAPALARNLWKQLKGRNSNGFVMFCKIGDEGAIGKAAFQKFLMDELRYRNAELIDYLFGILDLDGDGVISSGEFEQFWAEVKSEKKAGRKSHQRMSAYWLREGGTEQPQANDREAANGASPRNSSRRSSPRVSSRVGPPRHPVLTAPRCVEDPRGCKTTLLSQTGSTQEVTWKVPCPEN